MDTNTAQARYSRGAIALHWIIALLILGNFVGAWLSEDLPRPEKMEMMGYHKAFGLLILGLTVLRLVWRLMHRPPPLIETLKAWEAALAKVTHGLLYFLMLAIPLSGWVMSSAKGFQTVWFGVLPLPDLVGKDKALGALLAEVHETLSWVLVAAVVAHAAAALKHHFIDRDDVLARMLPARGRTNKEKTS